MRLNSSFSRLGLSTVLVFGIWSIHVSAENDIFGILKAVALSCAEQHGYEEWNPGGFEEYELRAGEKAWRQCVYSGIREQLIPKSAFPDDWEKMIAQDIEYTNAIENGEMTRYERWVNNRESRQLTLANEALAIDDKKLQMHRKVLDDYQRRQIEVLLRLPPPIPPIR